MTVNLSILLLLFSFIVLHRQLASVVAILIWQRVCRLDPVAQINLL
jgi:hypothetical protein